MKTLQKHAQATASMNVEGNGTDFVGTMVGAKLTEVQLEAAVEILRAADETIGNLLDIKA